MKKTVLLALGIAVSVAASAGIKENATVANLPKLDKSQRVETKLEKASVASAVKSTLSSSKLVKTMKDLSIYQTKDGKYVRVLNNRNRLNTAKYSKPVAAAFSEGASFSEDFNDWDGTTENWVPAGWSVESKIQQDYGTWGVVASNYYASAFDTYSLNITAAMDLDMETFKPIFPEQDEWCYTPEFTVANGDLLSFFVNYDPGYTLFNWDAYYATGEYQFNKENTNLEVKVSVDGGTNWTTVWDAVSDAKTYSNEELMQVVGTSPWKGVVCDMSAYVGKTVKLAFRFVGSAGNDVMIDNVVVGDATPSASYSLGLNTFVCSGSSETGSYYPFARLEPAYTDVQWTNTSLLGTAYEWEFASADMAPDATDYTYEYSDETNLTLNYPYGTWPYPVLTATIGDKSNSYQFGTWDRQGQPVKSWWQTGGWIADADTQYPVVNWEYYYLSGLTAFADMKVNGSSEDYTASFGTDENGEVVEQLSFDSFGVLLQAPKAPYAMNAVYVKLLASGITGDQSQPINVGVYALTPEGQKGELLASGQCYIADNINANYATQGYYIVPCYFTKKIGALTQQAPVTIDDAVLVCLSADGDLQFAPVLELSSMTGLSPVGYGDGLLIDSNYLLLKGEDGSLRYYSLKAYGSPDQNTGIWDLITGVGMSFDVFYSWLFEENGNYAYEAPVAGGESSAFTMNSLYSSDAWTIDGEGLYDWVNVTVGEYDTQTGKTELKFNVSELPQDVAGRSTNIVISTDGAAPVSFAITQGEAGVNAVAANAVSVSVVNGNFVVKGSNASSVDVYNVAGQKVASAAVDGETVVNAENLAKGMYILKFNDNTAIKVVK